MTERLVWSADRAEHIATRSARYPGAGDIDPAWTVEVLTDPDRVHAEPDPRSAHANSVRITGYSPGAGAVLTVVALREGDGVLHGATAWKATGAERRHYYGRPQ